MTSKTQLNAAATEIAIIFQNAFINNPDSTPDKYPKYPKQET